MTNTQRVEELAKAVGKLEQQLAQLDGAVNRLADDVRRLDPLLHDWSKTLDRLDKLEKSGDQWSNRVWDAAKLLLAAAVGGLVAYLVKR
jgi:outer membrane murein-binding lipoprotein Lpp